VLWLDANGAIIGTGLRAFLPSVSISNVRSTFFDVTDRPPLNAFAARLMFSKNASDIPLLLDLVNLVPVETKNLLRSPSFESGLNGWDSVNFNSQFSVIWEGATALQISSFPGFISQEIDLNPFRIGEAYLLSAAFAPLGLRAATITVRLVFINVLGNPIGEPGIDITILPATLTGQGKYLNFVQLSRPAPIGAVKARLEIAADEIPGGFVELDQVVLLRLASPNLIQNSEFDNGHDYWTGTDLGVTSGGYVGQYSAFLDASGGLMGQVVALPPCSLGRNFLFNFALHYGDTGNTNGNMIAQVNWLDAKGNEIGLALRLIVLQTVQPTPQWQVYTGITEAAPIGAASAIIRFTKSKGETDSVIGLDSVIFARID